MPLGRYGGPGGQTLAEIWEGPDRARQQAALDAGDFGLGCQECEVADEQGVREESLAVHFDRYQRSAVDAPEYPRVIDFALSNRCNLQCVMCNGGLSSSIRSQREGLPPLPSAYDDAFFEELRVFLPHLERAQFKGGEPFLSWETRRVWDLMIRVGCEPEVAVTTNGTIWNERVEYYLRQLKMHANLSVDDMTAGTLESIRVGVDHEQFWDHADRFESVVTETGAGMTLSYGLMPQNWQELAAFVVEVERRGCNGHVIPVNQPTHFDLLRLPVPELSDIVDRLEQQGRAQRSAFGSSAGLFAAQVERLRHHLDHPVTLRIGMRGPASGNSAEKAVPLDPVAFEAELIEWAGRTPVSVRLVDNKILDVDAPKWACWLRSVSWVGLHPRAIPDEITRVLGVAGHYSERLRDGAVIDINAEWAPAGAHIEFRALLLPPAEHLSGEQLLFLVRRRIHQ